MKCQETSNNDSTVPVAMTFYDNNNNLRIFGKKIYQVKYDISTNYAPKGKNVSI